MLKKTFAVGTLAAVVMTVAVSGAVVRAETRDVVETAVAAGSFKTLAKALDAAWLVTTLKGSGPFTVFGKVMASDVVKLQSAKAVSGDTIMVKVRNGVVRVDDATVTKADVTASNGVIHVIDSVILPKGL